jgi:hypothetical protein
MTAIASRTLSQSVGSACVIAFYLLYFWRVFKSNPGNRVVECGMITLVVFFSMLLFTRGDVPNWLFLSWVLMVVLLCFSTLFFLVQRGVRAARHTQRNVR